MNDEYLSDILFYQIKFPELKLLYDGTLLHILLSKLQVKVEMIDLIN
jgi:hypothetical protein